MRRNLWALTIMAAVLVAARPGHANQLDDIRTAGVLRTAVFDSNPPFGARDPISCQLVGYDIDFAGAIAERIGVRLQLVATNPTNRIPLLQAGKVDLIVAYLNHHAQRGRGHRLLDPVFSHRRAVAGSGRGLE
jgi:polar amino acid transport system substrate-binding protein